jgi:release factor glutamine methyltransferase
VAARNAERLGVSERAAFVLADGLSSIAPGFDILVSNPPYIRSADIAGLSPEVRRHDPLPALDGGPDGLAFYRHIWEHAFALVPDGFLALEVGYDQAAAVVALMDARAMGWPHPVVRNDLSGHGRCVTQTTHW